MIIFSPNNPALIPIAVRPEDVVRLQRLGILDCLVGKWPEGNQSLEEVTMALISLAADSSIIVRIMYHYPNAVDSGGAVHAELCSFTVCPKREQNSRFVDIMKVYGIS